MAETEARAEQMKHLAMVATPAFVAHLNWQERSHTEEDAWRFYGELEDALRDPEVADAVMKLARQTARANGSPQAMDTLSTETGEKAS